MKKVSLVLIILLCNQLLFSQSADKGRLNFNLGTGASLFSFVTSENVGDKGIALPTHTFLKVEYITHNRVGLGLEYYRQKFQTDDANINSVFSNAAGISLQYYFMNKPKSNAFIGTSVGGFGLDFDGTVYTDQGADSIAQQLFYGAFGTYNTLYLGYNKYFTKNIGLYVKAGLSNYPARMGYVNIDGDDVEEINGVQITDWKLLMRGAIVSVGLTFKFRNDKDKGKDKKEGKKKLDE